MYLAEVAVCLAAAEEVACLGVVAEAAACSGEAAEPEECAAGAHLRPAARATLLVTTVQGCSPWTRAYRTAMRVA